MAKRAISEEPYRPLLKMELISAAVAVQPESQPLDLPPSNRVGLNEATMVSSSPASVPEPLPTNPAPVEQRPAARKPILEHFEHQRRILFTSAESLSLERIAYDFTIKLKTQVKVSHIVRAMIRTFLESEKEIAIEALRSGPLSRPGNGSHQEIREFEQRIASLMESALLKRFRAGAIQ